MSRAANRFALALLAGSLCTAPGAPAHAGALPEGWAPVDPARLADMRGGFELPSGLALSFGIQRLVFIDGVLVAGATAQVPDVSQITAEQARALAAVQAGLVVQLGEGLVLGPAVPGAALVIQNTLDDQSIQVLTTLDIGVGTLGLFQQVNGTQALQDALVRVPGAP